MHSGFKYKLGNENIVFDPFSNLNGQPTLLNKCHISHSSVKIRNPYHKHDFFQFWYVLRGGCNHYFNGIHLRQSEGDLMIVPPYIVHYLDTSDEDDFELFCCDLPENFMGMIPDEISSSDLFNLLYLEPLCVFPNNPNPIIHFSGESHLDFQQICDKLYQSYNHNHEQFTTEVRINVVKMISFILQKRDDAASLNSGELSEKYRISIQNALDYIDTHFSEKLYLNQICQKSLLSSSTFSYLFKRITGKTFVEYLNYLRVQHACELLSNSDIPLYSISVFCGFGDNKNFSRIFKKMIGTKPSTYRKIHKHE